jgi:5-formyltetrahydrofolate cyclo-ligase
LRKELRQRRRGLSPSAQINAAEKITASIIQLPPWAAARRIALYLANDGEINTLPLSDLCRGAGKQLFLPVIGEQDTLTFAAWDDDGELVANRFGILEPAPTSARCAASELDIIILPLVAWDRRGGRLGMGGGFYDRALAGVEGAALVGLAHALQEVPRVPRDNWDIPLDFVVTETALHRCREDR